MAFTSRLFSFFASVKSTTQSLFCSIKSTTQSIYATIKSNFQSIYATVKSIFQSFYSTLTTFPAAAAAAASSSKSSVSAPSFYSFFASLLTEAILTFVRVRVQGKPPKPEIIRALLRTLAQCFFGMNVEMPLKATTVLWPGSLFSVVGIIFMAVGQFAGASFIFK